MLLRSIRNKNSNKHRHLWKALLLLLNNYYHKYYYYRKTCIHTLLWTEGIRKVNRIATLIVTDNRWKRDEHSLLSAVAAIGRPHSSSRKDDPPSRIGPRVTNKQVTDKSLYICATVLVDHREILYTLHKLVRDFYLFSSAVTVCFSKTSLPAFSYHRKNSSYFVPL